MLLNMQEIEGLKVEPPTGAYATISVGKTATPDSFLKLLAWLPESYRLGFFDQYYPKISDWGASVDVQRRGDRLWYKLGNHGWSGDWDIQSDELIAAWLALNLPRKGVFERMTSVIIVSPALDIPNAPSEPVLK